MENIEDAVKLEIGYNHALTLIYSSQKDRGVQIFKKIIATIN